MTKKHTRKSLSVKPKKSRKYPWLNIGEVEMLSAGGYFDSEGVLHNADGCPRCTSMVKSTGKHCKNFAVPGTMQCRIHGGTLESTKHGHMRLYSAFIQNPTLEKVYEASLQSEEISGIREELSLLRTLLAKVINETADIGIKEIKGIATVIGEVRQLVSDCTKAEVKMGQLIDIGKITVIVAALAKIIQKHVKDERIIENIAYEFDNIVWPAPLASTPQPERERPLREVPALPEQIPK